MGVRAKRQIILFFEKWTNAINNPDYGFTIMSSQYNRPAVNTKCMRRGFGSVIIGLFHSM